jgi:hypothetical protein
MIMSKTGDSLSQALGIENKVEILTPEEKTELVPVDLPDQESDYQLSRNTFRELIRKGNVAIDDMQELARQSEHPRTYEVFATMIKTIADVTKDLYDLQKKTKDLKEIRGKPAQPEGAIAVERAVFVGTTADLLRQVKEESK